MSNKQYMPQFCRVGIVGSRPSGSETHESDASRARVARLMTVSCRAEPT